MPVYSTWYIIIAPMLLISYQMCRIGFRTPFCWSPAVIQEMPLLMHNVVNIYNLLTTYRCCTMTLHFNILATILSFFYNYFIMYGDHYVKVQKTNNFSETDFNLDRSLYTEKIRLPALNVVSYQIPGVRTWPDSFWCRQLVLDMICSINKWTLVFVTVFIVNPSLCSYGILRFKC